MHTSYGEHQAVVDAILSGNSDLAAERLRGHVVVQGERFADLIASLAQFKAADTEFRAA
jgi:DNA-binding GntR family transcriptional regulator